MAKNKTSPKKAVAASQPAPQPATRGYLSFGSIREGIESLVVAFVLAFLFRGFEAEAFVIPTGSMAPTLMGAHKDILCPQCGYRYAAGASSESDDMALQRGQRVRPRDVVAATCPQCRFMQSVDPNTATGREYPTYGGDRILVSKLSYEFGPPDRWDVIVFKYPGEAQTNYIKRCVGLPDESLRIWHGDLYRKGLGSAENFEIPRRPPAKVRAMAQMVYDNDYVVDAMTEKGWPLRWQNAPGGSTGASAKTGSQGGWTSNDGGRSFETTGGGSGEVEWLRYRHFVPTLGDWKWLEDGKLPEGYHPRPKLITDFYAYDTSLQRNMSFSPLLLGQHWVGDLMLECQLEVTSAAGTALLDLVRCGRHFRCQIDSVTGQATLSIDGLPDFAPTARTAVRGVGTHRLAFANFDGQLLLWVDGAIVAFDRATVYKPADDDLPRSTTADPGDLAPAGVGAQSAHLRVSHLKLLRDVYYVAVKRGDEAVWDYGPVRGRFPQIDYDYMVNFWSTPEMWSGHESSNLFSQRGEALFTLAADQFFMLGDNSPLSQDARLWDAEPYVSRELLVGKALLIFWPHSFHRIPGTPIPFPFFPNVARMGLIR